MLRATLPLRQILISERLLHRVNRQYRCKIRYSVSRDLLTPFKRFKIEGRKLISLKFGLKNPQHGKNSEGVQVKESRFLAANCLFIDGRVYTVKEVIDACSYVKGGIHFDNPKNDAEDALLTLDESTKVAGDHEPSVYLLAGIFEVVVRACLPMVEKIGTDFAWESCYERWGSWVGYLKINNSQRFEITDPRR